MELDHSGTSSGGQTVTAKNRTLGEGEAKDLTRTDQQVLTALDESKYFLAEKTSDLVSVVTASDQPTYVYLNPAHKRILGYEPFAMIGKNPLDLIHPGDRENFSNLLKSCFPSKTKGTASKERRASPQRASYRIKDQPGDYRHLETTADRLDEEHILLMSKDTTEGITSRGNLLKDNDSLKQRLKEQDEELADSKKVLKEEIFKRWRAEEAFRESEEENKRLLESFEDGYFEVDLAGNLTFFNEALCRMVGYSHQELMGMNNRKYMTPETSKLVFETFNEVFRTGKATKAFDWELLRKDGAVRHVETSVSPIFGPGGDKIGFRGIARDVTERWMAEQACRESEEKYREILESIEDGYYEVDVKGNFLFFNESMCKILGYANQELSRMNNRDFMSAETSKKVFQTFNQVYRTGEPAKAFGWELIRKDGERRYVETSVSLIRNQKGSPLGFRGIARDITGIRRLEKAKERAINHLSHELGTPLSIIEGVVRRIPDELKKGNVERIHEWVERVKRNITRLKELQTKIDDILNERPAQEKERILNLVEAAIAFLDELKDEPLKESTEAIRQNIIRRLESLHKVEDIQKQTIVLDAFVHEVCQEARQSMKERHLEIVEKVEKGASVEMDPKVLRKVCEGFLKNAVENTPDEGKIEIELKKEDNLAKLSFHDFGTGITPENQKLIFSGFFHTQDTHHYASKKPYLFNAGGSGSDLLRARVLSERFGFSVDFSSTRCRYLPSDKDECPGRISSCPFIKEKKDCLSSGGSTFSICLPLQRSSPRRTDVAS